MRNDDFHLREISRYVIEVHRIRILQAQAATAGHAGAHAGMTAVENSWQAVFRDDFVHWIGHAVARKKSLARRVKLETFDAVVGEQAAHFAKAELAFVRIDASKGNHDVGI